MEEFIHTYRIFGVESHCKVQIFPVGYGKTVVVVTELPDNMGTSVTNAIEKIATEVLHNHGLDQDRVVWIEHYPDRNRPGQQDPLLAESWAIVTFTWDTSPGQYISPHAVHPRWYHISREEAERLMSFTSDSTWLIEDDWCLEQEYEDRFYYPDDYF